MSADDRQEILNLMETDPDFRRRVSLQPVRLSMGFLRTRFGERFEDFFKEIPEGASPEEILALAETWETAPKIDS